MSRAILLCLGAALVAIQSAPACAEELLRQDFEQPVPELRQTWGDKPAEVLANAVEPGIGLNGSSGLHLKLDFRGDGEKNLSYWQYQLDPSLPLIEGLQEISFRIKSNVPVALKIAIAPFGFVYHAPRSQGTGEWETVTLTRAWEELSAWCRRGERNPRFGVISGIIFAVAKTDEVVADLVIDELVVSGPEGASQMLERERFLRRVARVRVAVATQIFSDEGRTLQAVTQLIDEAALDRADILLLPQECVLTAGEPIPGPISQAIAAKAAEHSMYIVGNIRETAGARPTSPPSCAGATGRLSASTVSPTSCRMRTWIWGTSCQSSMPTLARSRCVLARTGSSRTLITSTPRRGRG